MAKNNLHNQTEDTTNPPNQSRDSQIDEVLVDLVSSYVRSGQSADYGTAKAALQKIIAQAYLDGRDGKPTCTCDKFPLSPHSHLIVKDNGSSE